MSYDKRLAKPNKKLILIDCDGVIAAWSEQYEKLTGLKYTERNHTRWDLVDAAGADFWANIPWTSWGKELYKFCVDSAPTIILTSPSNHPSSSMGKHAWLSREIGNRNWAISGPKWAFANENTLLIDDSHEKVDRFLEAGGHFYLFTDGSCLEDCKEVIRKFVG